jgi:hypothetical protein
VEHGVGADERANDSHDAAEASHPSVTVLDQCGANASPDEESDDGQHQEAFRFEFGELIALALIEGRLRKRKGHRITLSASAKRMTTA